MNRTLILFKPDAYRRGLVGELLARFEGRGLKAVGLKVLRPAREQLKVHYAEHKDSAYFQALLDMMSEGPLVACVLEGDPFIIEITRQMLGPFKDAAPGTIRGDYQTDTLHNLVHASSSVVAAMREIRLWFDHEELLTEEAPPDHGETT